jgi:hypothetical protein
MLAVMEHLAGRGGVAFHACAVLARDRAHILGGPSERGKSTLADLWSSAEGSSAVLSEEAVAVAPAPASVGAGWLCFGLPWGSRPERSDPTPRPLASLSLLRHAPRCARHRLDAGAGAEALLQFAFLPCWNRGLLSRGLDAVIGLSQTISVFDFGFTPDARAVEMVSDRYERGVLA